MSNPFTAAWSEQGHLICLGRWEISYQGRPLEIPQPKAEEDMGTYGIYSFLYPDDPEFAEGLNEDDWVLENIDWLSDLFIENDIPIDEQHARWFYQAVNGSDWRCGSCGGCT
ncbi:hypothetical protein [Sedimenticola selenatireducens]|jgi:hypothetical protein|uniref:Uncharacterized protein n=1 Tax=Sedimenticola selenatireducens TaxID=191960 RepID=A0A557SGU8_9GAMM|nr:hypothetical protein [Sedimenticola selenatireducens]TVO76624.1 hypothetical protein FHP88_04135 [Sedimenticola selenatireducens]TVT64067.1 MAG: hypothetical protein FHK78_07380 [Sedimenticola selenatireducens]